MKGDIILVEEHHRRVAQQIITVLLTKIKNCARRFIIIVAGESGSGKSETGKAIAKELDRYNINAVILGQDDYFVLPPKSNDEKRREDPEWLGPHIEVKLGVLDQNLLDAKNGINTISKPLVDYNKNTIEEENINLKDVKVIIAEGTYTSLLKNVDCRVFINRNRLDTLKHREKRNRGNEIGDSFIEQVLKTEHKIIAGHKQLADYVITKDYEVLHIK